MENSNYPPGVTGMEPEIIGYPEECEECGDFEGCAYGCNPKFCKEIAWADSDPYDDIEWEGEEEIE